MIIDGWILDVYPVPGGMCVWMTDTDGRSWPLLDPWIPSFYVGADHPVPPHLRCMGMTEKKEFFSNRTIPVWEIRPTSPLTYFSTIEPLVTKPGLELYNADLNLGQNYFYERGLFPLARCRVEADADGFIQAWELNDSPWELDYAHPPFTYAHLGIDSPAADPNHRSGRLRTERIVLTLGKGPGEGISYVMEGSEEELLLSLNKHMAQWDPDVLLSDWGDSYLMPRLQLYSQRTGVPLLLSRHPVGGRGPDCGFLKSNRRLDSGLRRNDGKSYMAYGKMVYKPGTRTLHGRLHIDRHNSFTFSQTSLEGLYEIARVARIPIQRAARSTIGTSLSSMQHNWAIQNNYLIPLDKGQTEDFRSADDLIASDRGGLVYEPEIGWHEDLIEFDFVSMYPEIMIRNNVTPEAVNCACCPENKVPEINHHLCKKRIGMVPAVLEPIVRKRAVYKEMVKANHPNKKAFQDRRNAFKWALVCCFGYLGFRNARFGRIEAHECVNAYSREALLKAKETAEADGFHFVHAIVDSLWLKKSGATDDDVERLRLKIEAVTGLPLGYEGRYRWIRFCPSRTNALVGVPNRYFGVFKTGEYKVRGIELRRHDTPIFYKQLQTALLDTMAQSDTLEGLKNMDGALKNVLDDFRDRLKNGQVSPLDLAVSVHLRQKPEDYVHDTLSAIAAKKLAASGLDLQPGETIQYVVSEEHDAVKDWRVTPLALIEDWFEYDRKYYGRLLERAAGTVLFGEHLLHEEPKRKKDKKRIGREQLILPGLA